MEKFILVLTLCLSIVLVCYAKTKKQVTWGVYCGECVSNCSTIYRINDETLNVDKSDSIFKSVFDNKLSEYKFNGQRLSDSEFEKMKWVVNEMPDTLFEHGSVIGVPDAYDQCGIYLEVEKNWNSKRMLIDPDQIPKDIEVFINELLKYKKITSI